MGVIMEMTLKVIRVNDVKEVVLTVFSHIANVPMREDFEAVSNAIAKGLCALIVENVQAVLSLADKPGLDEFEIGDFVSVTAFLRDESDAIDVEILGTPMAAVALYHAMKYGKRIGLPEGGESIVCQIIEEKAVQLFQ